MFDDSISHGKGAVSGPDGSRDTCSVSDNDDHMTRVQYMTWLHGFHTCSLAYNQTRDTCSVSKIDGHIARVQDMTWLHGFRRRSVVYSQRVSG